MTKKHRHTEPLRAACALTLRLLPALAFALLAVTPAHAEKADRSKPVNLEADRVTVDESKQTATFEGNVVLTQGTLIIRGDRMVVGVERLGELAVDVV